MCFSNIKENDKKKIEKNRLNKSSGEKETLLLILQNYKGSLENNMLSYTPTNLITEWIIAVPKMSPTSTH